MAGTIDGISYTLYGAEGFRPAAPPRRREALTWPIR
jgi:hypothetical protein